MLFGNFFVSLKKLFQNRKVFFFFFLKEGLGYLRRAGTKDLYISCPETLIEGFQLGGDRLALPVCWVGKATFWVSGSGS